MMLASMGSAVFLFVSRHSPTAVGRYTHLEKFRSSKNPFQRGLGESRAEPLSPPQRRNSPYHLRKLITQSQIIRNHGDKLRIGGLAAAALYGVSEI